MKKVAILSLFVLLFIGVSKITTAQECSYTKKIEIVKQWNKATSEYDYYAEITISPFQGAVCKYFWVSFKYQRKDGSWASSGLCCKPNKTYKQEIGCERTVTYRDPIITKVEVWDSSCF